MKVNLDIFEMGYLLDSCLRGSHLRASTVERFIDEWYDEFTPGEREQLFEWTYRLTYNRDFKSRSAQCGADREFMLRYNPDNQYIVHTLYDGKEEAVECYLDEGGDKPMYKTGVNISIHPDYIVSIEKIPFYAEPGSLLWEAVHNVNPYAKETY